MGSRTLIRSHEELNVYRLAFDASMKILELSKKFPREETYSLTDQISRSSRSVASPSSLLHRSPARCGHTSALLVGLLSAVLLTFFGCGNDNGEIGNYRYRSDMHEQPSFRKHEDPRPPVKGTVPVGGIELAIRDSAAAARLSNPVRPTAENADTARVFYETYCTPCHGLGGKGDGPVAAKFQVPPDLTDEKYRTAPDGYIYYVIRHGRLIMPPHYEAIKSHERWLIVNHLRTLQR
jgi:mono/diheme cytochrome c family protein